MLNLKTLALGALIAAASVGAMARPMPHDGGVLHAPQASRDIDVRQARQMARIDAALHSGHLSRPEFRRLQRGQVSIRRYEARAKADGVVTRAERRTLQDMLDRASRHIRSA